MNARKTLPKRLVVKVGTAQLSRKNGNLNPKVFTSLASQIVAARKLGVLTAVVSSGAILAGRQWLAESGMSSRRFSKKLLASIGQTVLMAQWRSAFKPHRLGVSQFLLTFYNCCHQDERQSLKVTLDEAMRRPLVPVVNENDPVSPAEIELMDLGFSENDVLASMVAEIIEADAIIFFSDAGGVYDRDPNGTGTGRFYRTIDAWNIPRNLQPRKVKKVNSSSPYGRGGIDTKLAAAALCFKAGMRVSIADLNGSTDTLPRFVGGEPVGTMMGGHTELVSV